MQTNQKLKKNDNILTIYLFISGSLYQGQKYFISGIVEFAGKLSLTYLMRV